MSNLEKNNRFFMPVIAILLLVVMTMWLFGIKDTYNIYLLFLVISLIVIRPLPFRYWSSIDALLCVITLHDIMSCFYSTCSFPVVHNALLSVTYLTTYLILRKLFVKPHPTRIFLFGSYFLIIIALVLTICSFFIFRDSVLAAGFKDTYHFRFLFRPLGYLTNQWAEVLIILLGWGCLIHHRFSSIYMFFMIWAILLSFSRGAYISLSIYLITYFIFMKSSHGKFRKLIICLIAFFGIFFYFPNETRTTLSMNATTSQQQSTKARINSTYAAWNVFKDSKKYYLFGHGSGSYPVAVDQALNQDSTQTYTTLAPNLPILLLIEKGIIGLLFYLFLIFNIYQYIYKHRKETNIYIIGCTFFALIVKEMTQANLFCVPIVWFMFYTMLAFLQRGKVCEKNIGLEKYVIPGAVTAFYLGWCSFTYFHLCNESICSQSFKALKKNRIQNAINLIEQTGEQTPYLIQRGRLYTECYRKTQDITYAQRAQSAFIQAHNQTPKDVYINYLQARLFSYMGKTNEAKFIAENLVKIYPKNSLYSLILWEILYKEGQKDKALLYLINAIRYSPRILTMQFISNLQESDSVQFQHLHQELSCLKIEKQTKPTDIARLGYIANWCGNKVKAINYLRKAVTILPNLSTPWLLLNENKKYRLLVLGAFKKNAFSITIPNEPSMTNELLLMMAYKEKFRNWYGSKLEILE